VDNVNTECKQNSYKAESLNMIIPDKLFVGGIIEGVNYKSRGDGLIDLNDCQDLIFVDRKYFLKYFGVIYEWALHVEQSATEGS
jgi:hypothetical protein